MRRFWIAGLAALCAAACATAPSGEELARTRLREAQNRLPDGAGEAEALARQVLAEERTDSLQRSATHVLAASLADQGRCDELTPGAERDAAAPDANAFAWRFAFALSFECENYSRASELLSGLYERYPDDIVHMPAAMVFRAAGRSRDASLLAFIVDGGWQPEDPAVDVSDLRLSLIRAHLANGDRAAATEAAGDLVESGTSDLGALVVLFSDRTFDPIVDSDRERFHFRRTVDRFVANGFSAYSANPQRLSTLNALSDTLQNVGRSEEALMLVDDALTRTSDFTDGDTVRNWTYQTRANLRSELGLEEEALDDITQGAQQSEGGRANVSQRLNRVGFLLNQGRPEEALAAAEAVEPARLSPYGRAVRRYFIVCSNAELGRTEAMRAALAEAAAHGADSFMQLQSAARCADDLDIAARAFISRLSDPVERRGAILEVQGFAGEPAPEDWLAHDPLFARTDVRAAIDAAMHVRTFPIRRQFH